MRLSDAIAFGRVFLTPKIGGSDGVIGVGCALDMAMVSVKGEDANWCEAREYWPWIDRIVPLHPLIEKYREVDGLGGAAYACQIYTLFDICVMSSGIPEIVPQTMTLDQLIDWVRSVEPPETEEIEAVTEGVTVAR